MEQHTNLIKLSNTDLHLEEPWQDIRELDVYDTYGEQIGSVEDLYVDQQARHPHFLDVSAGGFLGIGKRHFLIPVEEVSREVSENQVTVNHSREKVMGLPAFDPDMLLELDLQHAIYAYYARTY